jgi:hypothetical protein
MVHIATLRHSLTATYCYVIQIYTATKFNEILWAPGHTVIVRTTEFKIKVTNVGKGKKVKFSRYRPEQALGDPEG